MNDKIDFNELVKQEPEFADWISKAMIGAMLAADPEMIKSFYNFYSIGISLEQMTAFIKNSMAWKDDDDAQDDL